MKRILFSQNKSMFSILLFFVVLFLFPNVTYAGYFLVQHADSDFVVITDNINQYILDYDYECYDSDFSDGDTIYIKSTTTPSRGDTIVTSRYSSLKTCKVEDAEEVKLKVFFVNKTLSNDTKVIVTDKSNNVFLLDYGFGCLSLWRYENKNIFIDIGGSFLDGIGDTIYLPKDGANCRVWGAEKISDDGFGASYRGNSYRPTTPPKCPSHSTYTGTKCVCKTGYVADTKGDKCITAAKACENQYGRHARDDSEGMCRCKEGYEFNDTKSACINISCPVHSSRVSGKCVCNKGYIKIAGVCFAGREQEEKASAADQHIAELKRTIKIMQEKITKILAQQTADDNWQGFYYPNGCLACTEHYIISPIHKTKNECFVWADEVHKRRNYNTSDTYECGKNCKKHEFLDISICEETVNTKGSTETI